MKKYVKYTLLTALIFSTAPVVAMGDGRKEEGREFTAPVVAMEERLLPPHYRQPNCGTSDSRGVDTEGVKLSPEEIEQRKISVKREYLTQEANKLWCDIRNQYRPNLDEYIRLNSRKMQTKAKLTEQYYMVQAYFKMGQKAYGEKYVTDNWERLTYDITSLIDKWVNMSPAEQAAYNNFNDFHDKDKVAPRVLPGQGCPACHGNKTLT